MSNPSTDSTAAPELSNTTLVEHLSIVPVGRIPKFKLYPCQRSKIGKRDVIAKNSPISPKGPKGPKSLRALDEETDHSHEDEEIDRDESKKDGDACPNDARLITVEFRRIDEVTDSGKITKHSSVNLKTLRYTIDTSVVDTIKYSSTFDASGFAAKAKCTTVQPYTGSTTLDVIAKIIRAGSSVGVLGTVAEDSLKWSYNITNWPYCEGTTALDLVVLLNTRGHVKDEDNRVESSGKDGDDKDHDPRKPVDEHRGKRLPRQTVVGGLSKILFPTTATLDNGGEFLVTVSTDVFGRGSNALTHYKLPVSYSNAQNVTVYANSIYYDPSVSMAADSDPSLAINAPEPPTGLSAGAAGGIAAAVIVVVIAIVALVVYRRKSGNRL